MIIIIIIIIIIYSLSQHQTVMYSTILHCCTWLFDVDWANKWWWWWWWWWSLGPLAGEGFVGVFASEYGGNPLCGLLPNYFEQCCCCCCCYLASGGTQSVVVSVVCMRVRYTYTYRMLYYDTTCRTHQRLLDVLIGAKVKRRWSQHRHICQISVGKAQQIHVYSIVSCTKTEQLFHEFHGTRISLTRKNIRRMNDKRNDKFQTSFSLASPLRHTTHVTIGCVCARRCRRCHLNWLRRAVR